MDDPIKTVARGLASLAGLLLVLAWGLGCPAPGDDDDGPWTDDDDAADDDAADDDLGDDDAADDDVGDDDSNEGGPCGDGTWGQIPTTGDVLLVAAGGSAGGDGSLTNPFATLEEAVEAAREINDPVVIGIAPGDYPTNLLLTVEDGQFSDSGLTIAGCAVDEVKLSPEDPSEPTVAVRGADQVTLRAFLVEGGDPGIVIADSAGAEDPVRLEGLAVRYADRAGIVIDDQGHGETSAVLSGVTVEDTVPTRGSFGWGIAVQHAQATITGGSVSGTTQVGIFGHLADLVVDGVAIDDVAVDPDGAYGRGIHLQMLCTGMVRNTAIDSCADAGLWVHTGLGITLESNVVENTVPAVVPGPGTATGDGIVVTMGDEGFQPELCPATLLGNTAGSNGRSGIVIDGVWAELVGNAAPNNIFDPGGWGIVIQNAAVIGPGGDDFLDLDASIDHDPLELNISELDWIQVASD